MVLSIKNISSLPPWNYVVLIVFISNLSILALIPTLPLTLGILHFHHYIELF